MTRLVQGFGRCTRSATDYAAVVVISESVFTYLAGRERRAVLHPELQAELAFGLEQSVARTSAHFLANYEVFIAQGADWQEADAAIVEVRKEKAQSQLPGAADLMAAAPYEIEYQYAMWAARYMDALDAARTVLGCLRVPELRGYRAMWHYLAGNAASLANANGQLADRGSAAREQYGKASRAVIGIRWLSALSRYVEHDPGEVQSDLESSALAVVERLEAVFETLGSATNYRFDEAQSWVLRGLLSLDGSEFEVAHLELGRLLGYDAGKIEADASPDPWWRADDTSCFVFEDHAGAGEVGMLDATKARQAATHANWVRQNVAVSKDAEIIQVLVTPVTRVKSGAVPHLATVLTWPLESFRAWAHDALAALRELKKSFREPGDIQWRAEALEVYQRVCLSPAALKKKLERESAAVAWTQE